MGTRETGKIVRVSHNIHIPFRMSIDVERGEGDEVEFVYSGGRVKYFLESQMLVTVKIGRMTLAIFPTLHGQRGMTADGVSYFSLEETGDLLVDFEADVYLVWTLGNGHVWTESRMTGKSDGTGADQMTYSLSIPHAVVAGKSISYYFRLMGHLEAVHSKARYVADNGYTGSHEAEVKSKEYFLPNGYKIANRTVCDNPNGPFTNYSLKL